MPSPFPGMDPFIEMQEWSDFHHLAIETARELLMKQIAPQYVARAERRVYIEHQPYDDDRDVIVPDVAVMYDDRQRGSATSAVAESSAAIIECVIPISEEHRESYLMIRDPETLEVVTVIELLSPNNKRSGSDGQREYLAKRDEVLKSQSHLVEIDLLRGGRRMPLRGEVPSPSYLAVVSRSYQRPKVQAYPWSLRQACPSIPIPLRKADPDASLDLQEVIRLAYERARYDLTLNYRAKLTPALPAHDREWMASLLPVAK